MNFENWWLLSFPLFFLLGWLAAKIDVKQLVTESKRIPSTYIEGLNFLLNEEKDKAIEVLIQLSRSEPESVELQFAIGSLFRDKGDMQRALAVHQGLLDRPVLTNSQRNRAVLAVGQDFMKSGLYDRAEEFLKRVLGEEHLPEAIKLLTDLYVIQNDWARAIDTAYKLRATTGVKNKAQIAHFMIELAAICRKEGDNEGAIKWLSKAISEDSLSPRPLIDLGYVFKGQGRYQEAINVWWKLEKCCPKYIALISDELMDCHQNLGIKNQCLAKIKDIIEVDPIHELLLSAFEMSMELQGMEAANDLAQDFLRKTSDVTWAIPVLNSIKANLEETSRQEVYLLIRVLETYRQDKQYQCESCGFQAHTHYWRCPACRLWDTYPPTAIQIGALG